MNQATESKKCIIIPAHNEEANIVRVISGIRAASNADIVVIDDGSRDRTAREATGAGAFVVHHPYNMGYGTALQTGYKFAVSRGYDYLVQMDGDGQHKPESIPALFERVENRECDVLVGSRFLGK